MSNRHPNQQPPKPNQMPLPPGAAVPQPSAVSSLVPPPVGAVEPEVDAEDVLPDPVPSVIPQVGMKSPETVKKVEPVVSNKAIEVRAILPGFYRQARKSPDDKKSFVVAKWEDLATWMECVDPMLEKKHKREMAEYKQKLKEQSEQANKAGK